MDFISMLTELNSGRALTLCDSKFRELNEAVKGTLGKGKMVLNRLKREAFNAVAEQIADGGVSVFNGSL